MSVSDVNVVVDDCRFLLCPRCSGTMMHHTKVEVFERDEDENKVIRTDVGRYGTHVSIENNKHNPSLRRQGIRIWFMCEQCDFDNPKGITLIMAQHKGFTITAWEEPEHWSAR